MQNLLYNAPRKEGLPVPSYRTGRSLTIEQRKVKQSRTPAVRTAVRPPCAHISVYSMVFTLIKTSVNLCVLCGKIISVHSCPLVVQNIGTLPEEAHCVSYAPQKGVPLFKLKRRVALPPDDARTHYFNADAKEPK